MNILEFDYTDAKGKKTKRTAVELSHPTDLYLTIDVAELSPDVQLALIVDLKFLKERYDKQIFDVMANYDIKHNLRNFNVEKMENIVVEAY